MFDEAMGCGIGDGQDEIAAIGCLIADRIGTTRHDAIATATIALRNAARSLKTCIVDRAECAVITGMAIRLSGPGGIAGK